MWHRQLLGLGSRPQSHEFVMSSLSSHADSKQSCCRWTEAMEQTDQQSDQANWFRVFDRFFVCSLKNERVNVVETTWFGHWI